MHLFRSHRSLCAASSDPAQLDVHYMCTAVSNSRINICTRWNRRTDLPDFCSAPEMVKIGCPAGHKPFAILDPNVISCPQLLLVSCHKVSIHNEAPEILPLVLIVLPVIWEIYSGLRACRAKKGKVCIPRDRISVSKAKPFPLL